MSITGKFLVMVGLVALAQVEAKAGFSYSNSVTFSLASGSFGGSTLTLTGISSATTQSTPTFENLFNVALASSTASPSTDVFTVNFTDTLTITNIPPPGTSATSTLTITGQLIFTRSDTGGEISELVLTPGQNLSFQVDGEIYTLSQFGYTQPTVNNPSGAGNVSARFDSNVVPEPSSLALCGIAGAAGLGAARVRRRRAA